MGGCRRILQTIRALASRAKMGTHSSLWFETGAGWSGGLLFIPCCVGRTRKGQLPHPFSGYQALNIGEEGDFGILINELKKQFGDPEKPPELRMVIAELTRRDIRAEEREKTRAATLAATMDHAAIKALMMELEDNTKTATRFQIEHTYVPPPNKEWLKYRNSLSTLPGDLRTELSTTYQKIRKWKGNSGIGSQSQSRQHGTRQDMPGVALRATPPLRLA